MNPTSMRFPAAMSERVHFDPAAVWTWFLCLGLVVYLSLEGGGYDPLVESQVGIAGWWVLLLGCLVGALPRGRLSRPALAALGLLALFVVWTALSLTWTESTQSTWADLARITGYLGIFALALASAGSDRGRRVIAAVATGIVVVSVLALLSRLHAGWFPTANRTAQILNDPERLSYPLNYWNGVAAMVAIGVPLLVELASSARSRAARALAAAALPALGLTLYYTISRGGIAATVLAVAVYLAFAGDRLPRVLTGLAAGAGVVVLVLAAEGDDALRHGLDNATARSQGDEMLLLTVVVCALVGLVQLGLAAAGDRGMRPAWTRMSPRATGYAAGAAVLLALAVTLALGAPGRVSDAVDEFKEGGGPGTGTGRLGSAAGESRYQFWSVAAEENASRPLTGTGSGTFELWWARKGTDDSVVKDTHSLWMQTLGELGIVGLVLLAAFFIALVAAGIVRQVGLGAGERSPPAAALGALLAYCLVATFDWVWQLPAVTVTVLLLGVALVGPWRSARGGTRPLPVWARAGAVVAGLAAIVFIAIPFASTSQLRESEADARAGDLSGALGAARSAVDAMPGAAGPRLQEALVLEEMGRYREAVVAARGAAEREDTNWRNFLVLSRLEAENGEAARSVADYKRARSLNPRFSLFAQPG